MTAKVNDGWEEIYEIIRRDTEGMELFDTVKLLDFLNSNNLITTEQRDRSGWKINILQPFMLRLAVNMIKGSVKYTSDDWSDEVWRDMGMDDKADSINYDYLWQYKLRNEGKI
jgi:hypothetical protein